MKRYLLIMALAGLVSLLMGCNGFDRTELLIHPETAEASETLSVALANIYLYPDTGSKVSKRVVRDSLHLCVGLPESWEVTAARMVVVDDMEPEQLVALQSGTMDALALMQLAQKYLGRTVDLPPDAGLAAALSGKTVTAHGRTDDENVTVNADSVKQWKGFSAPVNIVLEKGRKLDTAVSIDSAIALASDAGLLDDSILTKITELKADPLLGRSIPKTVGICVVPIAVFLQIKAGDREGEDTLYYFTKTHSMNPQPSSGGSLLSMLMPGMGDLDVGDMTYAPIIVGGTARVTSSPTLNSAPAAISVMADGATGTVRIDLGSMNSKQASIGIYTLQGNLVRTLKPWGVSSLIWNGADQHGNRVGNGPYLIRITGNGGSTAHRVQLVR